MGISRYRTRDVLRNGRTEYNEFFRKRDVTYIDHYSMPEFKRLLLGDIIGADLVRHTWESGDRFFKLADTYYGDSTYWWIIAFFNNRPLETDLALGDIVIIPTPLEVIISAMEI